MLSNFILISNYINSNLSNKAIIPMINDMIIGIIGVTQCSIYLQQNNEFIIKATNGKKESIKLRAIENSILYKKIEKSAKCDALIGIYNRKTFYQIVNERVNSNNVREYEIVMIDFDNFKKINDTLGYQFGDKILIHTTILIKSMLRKI